MTSHFLAIRVRPASRRIPRAGDGSLPDCWLLAEWPPEAEEPTDYWLSNLPDDTPHRRAGTAGEDPLAGRDGLFATGKKARAAPPARGGGRSRARPPCPRRRTGR